MSIYEWFKSVIGTITSNEDVSMILEIMSSGVLLAFFQSVITVSRLIINARELKRGKKQKYLYNKIGPNFWMNYCKKISALGFELVAIAVYYIFFIALAYVEIFIMNVCSWINNKHIITWIIVVIFGMLFGAKKVAKDGRNMYERVAIIALVFAEGIIIAVHINTIKTNVMLLIAVIVIESLILTMIYASNIAKVLKKYFRENKVIKGIRLARYCILPCLTLNAIVTVGSGIVHELVVLWGILWGIEYIGNTCVLMKNEKDVIVKINEGEVETKNSIVQYEDGTIKYIALDKKEFIVKFDSLYQIVYEEEYSWFTKKKRVFCFLEGMEVPLEFDYYKKIHNEWSAFYSYREEMRVVTLLRTKDINKVIIEDK